MKKKLAAFLTMMIVLSSIITSALVPALAVNYKNNVKLKSKAVLLINMDTGQTVFEKNADKKGLSGFYHQDYDLYHSCRERN